MAALDGMRVLDMTQYEAGTSCTQHLAWLGADVVKIEGPTGDPGRLVGLGANGADPQYFMNYNGNKRSMVLNLKSERGRQTLLDLVPHFDVFVENYGPGVLESLNINIDELRELNPRLDIVAVGENVTEETAGRLVAQADVVVDAAPLFEERFALNRAAVAQGKPMVECSMYSMEAHVTTILPGRTACLQCLVPEKPTDWKRQFPVIGAVSGTAGCVGAVEVVKLLTGIGESLAGAMLVMDLRTVNFRRVKTARRPACPVCGAVR